MHSHFVLVGGKTAHIGQLMKDRGALIALDKSKSKMAKLKENLANSGLTNTHVYRYDSTRALSDGRKKYFLYHHIHTCIYICICMYVCPYTLNTEYLLSVFIRIVSPAHNFVMISFTLCRR